MENVSKLDSDLRQKKYSVLVIVFVLYVSNFITFLQPFRVIIYFHYFIQFIHKKILLRRLAFSSFVFFFFNPNTRNQFYKKILNLFLICFLTN